MRYDDQCPERVKSVSICMPRGWHADNLVEVAGHLTCGWDVVGWILKDYKCIVLAAGPGALRRATVKEDRTLCLAAKFEMAE
jgi:hypothetical protein